MTVHARSRWKITLAIAATLAMAACGNSGESTQSESESDSTQSGSAFDAEKYFAGKTIRVIVSANPGGGSDLYGRLLAGRLPDAIPGKPTFTVTNDSGLGGNQNVYDAPERDLVIGVSSGASDEYTSVLDPAANIDASKVQIIGATTPDPRGLALFTDAATAYGDDFRKVDGATTPELIWADTVGSPADLLTDSLFSPWLCETFKAPCKMVSVADSDPKDLDLMIQRKELNTQLATQIALLRIYNGEITDGSVKVVFGYGVEGSSEVTPPPGVKITDVADILPPDAKADYERLLPVIGGGGLGKHFWAGPNMPAEAVETLRAAYTEVLSDPKVVEDLQTAMSGADAGANYSFKLSPVSGEEGQDIYDKSSGLFAENLDYYKEVQQKLYDKYWK